MLDLSVENAFKFFDFGAGKFVVANEAGEEWRHFTIENAVKERTGLAAPAGFGFDLGLELILAAFFAGFESAFLDEAGQKCVNGLGLPCNASAEGVDDVFGS